MTVDILKTIEPDSSQINADDLLMDTKIITITGLEKGTDQQPINIYYENDGGKAYRPSKGMRRVIAYAWGGEPEDVEKYIGRSLKLYRDPKVKFGKDEVGGVRIMEMSHIKPERLNGDTMTMALMITRGVRRPFTVRVMEPPAGEADTAASKADAIAQATSAASCGTKAFMSWFNSDDGKSVRGLFKDDAKVMAKLKAACTDADEQMTADMVDEEFGKPFTEEPNHG